MLCAEIFGVGQSLSHVRLQTQRGIKLTGMGNCYEKNQKVLGCIGVVSGIGCGVRNIHLKSTG